MARTYNRNVERRLAIYSMALKYAMGYENKKTASFFCEKLFEECGEKCSTRYMQNVLQSIPRIGFENGLYGGYFIIATQEEAKTTILNLEQRAQSTLQHAKELRELYNIKD